MKSFAKKIIAWHKDNPRHHPWKYTSDPYKIWLSEIILQQTQVAQGTPYYKRFINVFPSVEELANADVGRVLKLWEGLGYYSRARNLHNAAKTIVVKYNGVFPSTYEEIISLKGVGPYTAAAIASFAFRLPYAVVDGNVLRVLSRYYGITEAIDTPDTRRRIESLAQSLLSQEFPDLHNQAIMDLGATICRPKNPICADCPLSEACLANTKDMTGAIPYKSKKTKRSIRHFNYLVITDGNHVFLDQRKHKDIWQGLFQFPLLETQTPELITQKTIVQYLQPLSAERIPMEFVETSRYSQNLTHQTIHFCFWKIILPENIDLASFEKVSFDQLTNMAFPKTIKSYIENELL